MGCANSKNKKKSQIVSNQSPNFRASYFVKQNLDRFLEIYTQGKLLGSGSFSEVRTCFLKENGERRAVKIIKKALVSNEVLQNKIENEKQVLKSLDHPNIMRIYEYFEDKKKLYIILEYCGGSEMFSQMLQNSYYSESQVAKIMTQLFSAVSHIHSRNIVHRDLKPENIFLDSELNLKIIDFSSSVQYPFETIPEIVSNIYYTAPEVMLQNYDFKCDLWSCGMLMHILLSGYHPFYATNRGKAQLKSSNTLDFSGKVWKEISEPAKNLLNLLICDKSSRISASEALSHEWICYSKINNQPETPLITNALLNLKEFRFTSLLRDAIHTYLTMQRISSKDTKILAEVFRKIDTNGDGRLSREELVQEYKKIMGLIQAENEVDRIMKEVDTDQNGFIDYTEFLKAAVDTRKLLSAENLRSAFRNFDKDFSGKISLVELKRAISDKGLLQSTSWSQILKEVDENGDGEIDIEEFEKLVLRN